MKPNASIIDVTDSMPDVISGEFSIDLDSIKHLMGILTNMYADPEAAVIREYICNAYDAHVEAGTDRPVEVTTPNRWGGTLIIQDFGTGMSVDDIVNVYAKYGASTKRDSDNQIGMYGIGSKSALTYTNAFTVISIKNGVKAQMLVNLNSDRVPEYSIVDTAATDEPNGVTISIPVQGDNNFTSKVTSFLKNWDTGQVLLNGSDVSETGKWEKITDVVWKSGSKGYYQSTDAHVIMGNVAYPLDLSQGKTIGSNEWNFADHVVLRVPIGAVSIAPSRDLLQYDPMTLKYLDKVHSDYMELLAEKYKADIKSKKNIISAWRVFANMPEMFQKHLKDYKWKTHLLQPLRNTHIDLKVDTKGIAPVVKGWFLQEDDGWHEGYRTKITEPGRYIQIGELIHTTVLAVGFTNKPTTKQRRQIMQVVEELGGKNAIILSEKVKHDYLGHLKVMTVADVAAVVLPKRVRAPRAANGTMVKATFEYYFNGIFHRDLNADLEKDDLVCWIQPSDLHRQYSKNVTAGAASGSLPGWKVVYVGKNRQDRFHRENPGIIHYKTAAHIFANEANKKLKQIVTIDNTAKAKFAKLCDVTKIPDKELAAGITEFKNTQKYRDANDKINRQLNSLTYTFRSTTLKLDLPEYDEVKPLSFKKYPLVNGDFMEDSYSYIKMKFKEKK